jgi:type I restriction enzyme S subunit
LLSIEVPCISAAEQQADIVDLTRLLDEIKQLDSSVTMAMRRQRALKRALMEAAFSGRLTGQASDVDLAKEMAGV